MRDRLELWFSAYCRDASRDKAADLRARFRKADARQHVGAWWELYVYWLLRSVYPKEWIGVEVERPGAKRPDFCLGSDEGSRPELWVEAVTTFSGIVEKGRHSAREAYVLDAINELQSRDFRLWITFRVVGENTPTKREITEPLQAWLGSLVRDDVVAAWEQERVRPRTILSPSGWEIVLDAIPKTTPGGHPNDRLIGVGPISSGFVNDMREARKTILEKGRRYKELGAPLVVAVLPSSPFFGSDDASEALFGSEAVEIDPHRPEDSARVVRRPDGAWSKPRKRISGVLFGPRILPWTVGREWPELWLNPHTDRPLGDHLAPLPRVEVDEAGSLRSHDVSESPARLLGLPPDWPGSGNPFDL